MVVNTTWGNPATVTSGGGLDMATGDTLTETIWDRMASDLYRLGGTAGNAKTGNLQIGSTQTFSNGFMTQGLTINQDAADDEVWAVKSTGDVAHGMTAETDTDTYGYAKKIDGAAGGLLLGAYSEGQRGFQLRSCATTEDTAAKTTASLGNIHLTANLKSGTGITSHSANASLMALGNLSTTRFVWDADGDGHADVAWITYDDYDDLALAHDLQEALTSREMAADPSGAMTERRKYLEATKIINPGSWHLEHGQPRAVVNMTKLAMLHHGALLQVWRRLQALETPHEREKDVDHHAHH